MSANDSRRAGEQASRAFDGTSGPSDGLWAAPSDRRTVVEEARGRGPGGRNLDSVTVDRTPSGMSSCAYAGRHWAFAVREWTLMGAVWLAATLGWYACALLLSMPPFQAYQWRAVGSTYALVVIVVTVLLNGLDTPGRVFFGAAVGLPVLWAVATLSVLLSPFWGPPVVCASPFVFGLFGGRA